MTREIIREEFLKRFEEFKDRPDLVKIITGVRRSGKSTLLSQFGKRLIDSGEKVVMFDLEENMFSFTTDRDLHSLITESMSSPNDYVLLDEVQYVRGWENVVNTLRRNGANVYVTGSNATILSSDFSTVIAGRYAEIHVFPFSFAEFLERYPPEGKVRTEQRFDQYIRYGGMPIVDVDDPPRKNKAIMEGVYDSIVNRDITTRSRMESNVVRRMTDFMYSNIGNMTTIESLGKGSGIADRRSVDRYLGAICDSFVFYKVDSYDLIGKKKMKVKAKYYASDIGLRNTALRHTDDGASGVYENIVYLELLRRGYDVVIGSYRDYEVDFTVRTDDGTEFFQVAKTIGDPSTAIREERPLKLVGNGTKTILTMDRNLPEEKDGVRYRNIIDFLLDV